MKVAGESRKFILILKKRGRDKMYVQWNEMYPDVQMSMCVILEGDDGARIIYMNGSEETRAEETVERGYCFRVGACVHLKSSSDASVYM